MKDPARSENAVCDPRVMAPNAVVIMPVKRVAGMGQDRDSVTLEKKCGKGVALSRDNAHHVRPTVRKVPTKHGTSERKTMNSSPNVAPVEPVA